MNTAVGGFMTALSQRNRERSDRTQRPEETFVEYPTLLHTDTRECSPRSGTKGEDSRKGFCVKAIGKF